MSYQRVLLKLSGEALLGKQTYGIDEAVLNRFAAEVKKAVDAGYEIAVVIGGGNIFRGVKNATAGMKRAHADYMGMLATVINAMALQDALEQAGLETRLQSAIEMNEVAEPFIRRRAIRHLEKGRVVIFGAGTGRPFFTTDTAAALYALEIDADVLVKGTRVNGIYTADPEQHPDAERLPTVSGEVVLREDYRVMDMTAFTLCRESGLPIIVFNMHEDDALLRVVAGEEVGTFVHWTAEAPVRTAPQTA